MKLWFHNLFVPHAGNDHSPHFWRDKSIGLLLAIVLVIELAIFAQSFLVLNKNFYLAAVLPGVLLSLTNDERATNEAAPVVENPILVEAARLKVQDMAARGYFAHNSPEGHLPWYWLEKAGYSYEEAGENLAVNFYDSKDVVNAWMRSPTHRANIVKKSYSEMGIAMTEGVYEGRPTIFVAQFFGTPKKVASLPVSASIPVAIATSSKVAIVSTKNTQSASSSRLQPRLATSTATAATSSRITQVQATSSASVATTTASTTLTASIDAVPQVAGAEIEIAKEPSAIASFIASPRHAGMYVLAVLLGIILAAFLILLFMTQHLRHPRISLLTAGFILIITGLLIINTKVLKEGLQIDNGESTFISTTASSANF